MFNGKFAIGLVFLLGCAMASLAEAPPAATITIECDKPGIAVSPSLYGIFFEEINCAGDGGLYAEMVRNRSFEEPEPLASWQLRKADGADGKIVAVSDAPRIGENANALCLTHSGGKGAVQAENEGYWGFAVKNGARYEVSFLAKGQEGFTGPIAVTFYDQAGRSIAHATTEPMTADWKQFRAALIPDADGVAPRFAIGIETPGSVVLDMASIFPKAAFKDRANGLRPDLAEKLAALRPAFLRFPGGCWVEGETLEHAMRWKRTIGDPAGRRTQYNIWQYHSTNGLGYHEYLQLCEDLKAAPLFVINCGMSHKENVPMEKMGEWVRDALDAIEYANGPANSTWGQQRAANGHPASFNLRMLEIGNENAGPAYEERYALFYDAIKERYAEMQLIANARVTSRPMDILDEHYYAAPEFFMRNANRYDNYDRKGPKIYVGEYAVTQNCGAGNLRGAVGEAAFMVGMERNSDTVIMSSYAPLFANVNYKKWNPDLINFDASRSYGTPSYHVQKLFSENRCDRILPLSIEVHNETKPTAHHGRIGVGTWATQAEFKDLRVEHAGKVLLADDSAHGANDWKTLHGQWTTQDHTLAQTSGEPDCRATAGDAGWSDYAYTLKARKRGGAEGFLILFHAQDDNNWVWWNLGGWGNLKHALERCENGGKSILGNEAPGRIETNRWYDIRIETEGESIRCYLDGKLIHDVKYPQLRPYYAVAGRAGEDIVLKVVNAGNETGTVALRLKGAPDMPFKGHATTLTSPKPDDENTLDEPAKIAPVDRKLNALRSDFDYTFPANSVTILRLEAQR